jgi:hypothetical protein
LGCTGGEQEKCKKNDGADHCYQCQPADAAWFSGTLVEFQCPPPCALATTMPCQCSTFFNFCGVKNGQATCGPDGLWSQCECSCDVPDGSTD